MYRKCTDGRFRLAVQGSCEKPDHCTRLLCLFWRQVISDIHKPFHRLSVPFDRLVPHGRRSDPDTALSVKRLVDNHGLEGFGMPGYIQDIVFVSFEMAVTAGSDINIHDCFSSAFIIRISNPFMIQIILPPAETRGNQKQKTFFRINWRNAEYPFDLLLLFSIVIFGPEGGNSMSKNIVVITGSPRAGGNTDMLADAFIEGAAESGNTVRRFNAARMHVSGCLDCKYCFSHEGKCALDDDMQEVCAALREADVLVLASPVYWYGLSGQIKIVIDRMFAGCRKPFPVASAVLLLVYGDPDADAAVPAVTHFKAVSHYMGWKNIGIVTQGGVHAAGEIRGSMSLTDAEELGRSIR